VDWIEPVTPIGVFEYKLPPSKSHMIRQLLLASKSTKSTEIRFNGTPGEDIVSMSNCLKKMAVDIQKFPKKWIINPHKNGLIAPKSTLFCGNSGTVARIMTAIAANFDVKVTIDGDESLRKRSNLTLASCLRELGCQVSSDGFPCTVKGPLKPKDIEIDSSKSSQPISALILSSSDFKNDMKLTIKGKNVSRGYLRLTIKLANESGFENDLTHDSIKLSNWEIVTPEVVKIPSEMSLYPMATLLDNLHDGLQVEIEAQDNDELLFRTLEELEKPGVNKINLRDASDIISPLAALMAISDGGEIFGASHAKGKESNRIIRTKELLNIFSLDCDSKEDGLSVSGSQIPKDPETPIDTHMDHRLAMTAVILATYCGAKIVNSDIIKVTHPDFMDMIKSLKSLQP
jgi:3-phosphoshikimate 1-carboxyvinyltransferase